MRKLFVLAATALMLATSAFAGEKYHGDIQFHNGLDFSRLTTTTLKSNDSTNPYDNDITLKAIDYTIDVETWHLFDLNRVVSLGFMANLNCGMGGVNTFTVFENVNGVSKELTFQDMTGFLSFHAEFIVGPAVGITLGDVVRFDGSFGLVLNVQCFNVITKDNLYQFTTGGTGFGTTVQAKFMPNKKVSPIIGFRYSQTYSDNITVKADSNNSQKETTENRKSKNQVLSNATGYLGLSINW